ncbi:MAG: hypothetical protein IJ002_07675 [Clostridia bacterium]|nr:hypothetical protein [Clostridia bacterium]
MKFTEKVQIFNYDVDMHGNLRPTALLAKLEEVGSNQMTAYPPNNDDLRKMGLGFILSRVVMRVYKNLRTNDVAEGQTWAATTSRGLSYNRCYRLVKDGEPVADVFTVWALLSFNEGRLIRLEECKDMHIGGEPEEPFELDIPLRVRMPKAEEFREVAKRKVYYSDTDINGHMNNTKYLNMLCDFVPEIEKKSLRGININYVNEAPLGDELTVYLKEDDGMCYFKTVRSDGKTNCEAVLYF